MTLRECSVIIGGHSRKSESEKAMAYYQAYMSGVFSQPYSKGKFPKYGTHAPWVKGRVKRGPDYDKKLERMMQMLTVSMGGSVH
jgi:hypothetical protein